METMTMKYQLVLQLPAASIKDYDDMIELEETIAKRIGELGEVDGHDMGSGETNIFIHTNSPNAVFDRIKAHLGTKDFLPDMKVAYREIGQETFTIIHPDNLEHFSIK